MKAGSAIAALVMCFLIGMLVGSSLMRRAYESAEQRQHIEDLFQNTWNIGYEAGVAAAGVKCSEEMVRLRRLYARRAAEGKQ